MSADMPRLRGNNSLIGFQECINHNCVCLSSAYKKLNNCIFASTGLSDPVFCRFRELIKPVSCCLQHIRVHHLPHYGWMSTFCIVTGKVKLLTHFHLSLY